MVELKWAETVGDIRNSLQNFTKAAAAGDQ